MGESCARDVQQRTTRRELVPYVIEQPIVVPTGSIVRIESGANATRKRAFSDERSALQRPNNSHKV